VSGEFSTQLLNNIVPMATAICIFSLLHSIVSTMHRTNSDPLVFYVDATIPATDFDFQAVCPR
jgi:hypothetical protein